MVVEEVVVHRDNNVNTTLAIPIESEPTKEDFVTVRNFTPSSGRHNSNGKLRYSWEVDLGPFKLGRITRQ